MIRRMGAEPPRLSVKRGRDIDPDNLQTALIAAFLRSQPDTVKVGS